MKAGGSKWRMLWRKSPRRPANSIAPGVSEPRRVRLRIESHSSYLRSTSSTTKWKTTYQPPESSASSYDLSHDLDRRVVRIILTTSWLASISHEEMRSSQKMSFTEQI